MSYPLDEEGMEHLEAVVEEVGDRGVRQALIPSIRRPGWTVLVYSPDAQPFNLLKTKEEKIDDQ